jgi:two-component sensor histidine kinase
MSAKDVGGIDQESDHRIANHLAMLAGMVRLKAADLTQQRGQLTMADAQLLLDGVRTQIEAVAHLHRALAIGGPHASIDLAERLHDVCASLSSMLVGRIALIEDLAAGCGIGADRILPLTPIVAEVLTNAIKHTTPAGGGGRILVRARERMRRGRSWSR